MHLYTSLLLTLLIVISLNHPADAGFSAFDQQADTLVDNGGFVLSGNNHIVVERNSEKLFIPASILKIATSLASLPFWGLNIVFIPNCI